jgi:glycosyltransferase involved in cell wall biosynthesis
MSTMTDAACQKECTPETALRTKLVHITTVPISLNFFRGQIAYLKSRGFEVQAISSPGELLEQAAQREQIEVHAVPMSRGIDPTRDVVALVRLCRLLRALRPDIVHSHTPKAGLLGTIAARLMGVRVVMLSIFGLPQMTRTGFKRRLLDATTRLSCRLAHRIWCDGESMRDYLIQEKLCSADKVVVLGHGSSNGVNSSEVFSPERFSTSDRHELRARYGIPSDAPVLCFVGRIVADKGMHELAKAWRELRDRHPNLHLLLVGPFESQDPLLAEDETLFRSDERIHLAGMRDDVPLHLAASDILVNPSHREGFNVALLEGSAMGLPVVATRIPGCIDPVQEDITGTLVPPRDGLELSRAIESYLQNPALRRQHGDAGRARVVSCFQPQSIWEALEREYRRLGS